MGIKLIQKVQRERQQWIGRFSDGSDRSLVTYQVWDVSATDGSQVKTKRFKHDPTDEEIASLFPIETELQPTTAAQWERVINDRWQRWWMAKTTYDEAVARALPLAERNWIQNKMNAYWTAYRTALQAWAVAP